MPPILTSNENEKMSRNWYDYGPGQLDHLTSDEQRAWLHGSTQMGPPSRQSSLEGVGGLNVGQNHGPPHGFPHAQNHGQHHVQNYGRSGQQFHRNPILDNAAEDLLNNHFLSRAQRNESLASSRENFRGNIPPEFSTLLGRLSHNSIPNRLNSIGGGMSSNPMNRGRHPSNSFARRLSSIGSIDLNPIGEKMSSIGSLGDVSELLNSALASRTNAPASRSGSMSHSLNPSSESAALYMEMLKSGNGPLLRDQSAPSPPGDLSHHHRQTQHRPSAAELLMQHRLISLEPAKNDDLSRLPPNLENLTNRLLENEKENSLIASTMASIIGHNSKSSKDPKSVVDQISDRHHQTRGEINRNNFGYNDQGYTNPADPQGRIARPSPRRQVPPRRFLNLNDSQDNRMIPHQGEDVSRLPSEGAPLPYKDSSIKSSGHPDERSRSTAEASRSTAELLIQLNQGKLSSRAPSDNSANGWPPDHSSYSRKDSQLYPSKQSGANPQSQSPRRPVQPRSFLPSNYPKNMQGPPNSVTSSSRPILPQQLHRSQETQQSHAPNNSNRSSPKMGEKRKASDMVAKREPENDSNSTNLKSTAVDASTVNSHGLKRFKPYHEDKWLENFQQLLKYKEENGNCLVPHTYLPNPLLARWVKRQRRQYKLFLENCPQSTMTPDRIAVLNKEGFVWDSHEITWMSKFYDLIEYKKIHGHCRVPSCSKDHPQLATWVKCQRRQYRLKREGKSSAMTAHRIKLLDEVGFSWEVRFAAPANNGSIDEE